jgi:hypothetical protein
VAAAAAAAGGPTGRSRWGKETMGGYMKTLVIAIQIRDLFSTILFHKIQLIFKKRYVKCLALTGQLPSFNMSTSKKG